MEIPTCAMTFPVPACAQRALWAGQDRSHEGCHTHTSLFTRAHITPRPPQGQPSPDQMELMTFKGAKQHTLLGKRRLLPP